MLPRTWWTWPSPLQSQIRRQHSRLCITWSDLRSWHVTCHVTWSPCAPVSCPEHHQEICHPYISYGSSISCQHSNLFIIIWPIRHSYTSVWTLPPMRYSRNVTQDHLSSSWPPSWGYLLTWQLGLTQCQCVSAWSDIQTSPPSSLLSCPPTISTCAGSHSGCLPTLSTMRVLQCRKSLLILIWWTS